MAPTQTRLVDDAATALVALSPLRRSILAQLAEPASAAGLSAALGLPRQKIGYHLRLLEQAGLIAESSQRQRRGFTERLFAVTSDALVIDPMLLAPADPDAIDKQDRHSAAHLVRTAAGIVREVTRMRAEAEREGTRLLTLTIEADLGFAAPREIDAFAERLAQAVADIARDYPVAEGRKTFRLTATHHPAIVANPAPAIN